MILETICVGTFQVNCYILSMGKNRKAIIIDPGDQKDKIEEALDQHKLKPAFIINTHGHIDHIGSDQEFAVPIYIHRDEAPMLASPELNLSNFLNVPYSVKSPVKVLDDKSKIVLDEIELEVIHTPGHTRGGICLLLKKPVTNILFSGDTLFYESVGRTDFAGASAASLMKSIKEKLLLLPDDTVIYPGHGRSSTIGHEKRHNPFLKCANLR